MSESIKPDPLEGLKQKGQQQMPSITTNPPSVSNAKNNAANNNAEHVPNGNTIDGTSNCVKSAGLDSAENGAPSNSSGDQGPSQPAAGAADSSRSDPTNSNTKSAATPNDCLKSGSVRSNTNTCSSADNSLMGPIPRKKERRIQKAKTDPLNKQSAAAAGPLSAGSEEKKSDSCDEVAAVSKKGRTRGSKVSQLEPASNTEPKKRKSASATESARKAKATKKSAPDDTKSAKKARVKTAARGKKKMIESNEKPVAKEGSQKTKVEGVDAIKQDTPEHSSEDAADISLIPDDPTLISEYYNLLVRNVEFFYPSKSKNDELPSSGLLEHQLGVRCKHCKHAPDIPMDITSIASVLETIGSRHFCELLHTACFCINT